MQYFIKLDEKFNESLLTEFLDKRFSELILRF